MQNIFNVPAMQNYYTQLKTETLRSFTSSGLISTNECIFSLEKTFENSILKNTELQSSVFTSHLALIGS